MFENALSLLEASIARGECSCAALAVGVRNNPPILKSLGRVCVDGPAADVHTRFDLASLTKIFAPTLLCLRAFEEGRMGLFDPLSLYFPVPEDKKAITLFHLMTHTSGLVSTQRMDQLGVLPAHVCAYILSTPLESGVGEVVRYSCFGYILLGYAIEAAYGKPLDALAQEQVFAPLGMENTGYTPAGGNIAATEIDPATGACLCGVVHDENARLMGGVSGNAGVFSDIGDCARLCAMLACNGRTKHGFFLSPATLAAATRCYTHGKGDVRGLGFHHPSDGAVSMFGDLFPRDSYGHTGFTGTSIAIDPHTGIYVALLSNRVHPSRRQESFMRTRRLVHNTLYAELSKTL